MSDLGATLCNICGRGLLYTHIDLPRKWKFMCTWRSLNRWIKSRIGKLSSADRMHLLSVLTIISFFTLPPVHLRDPQKLQLNKKEKHEVGEIERTHLLYCEYYTPWMSKQRPSALSTAMTKKLWASACRSHRHWAHIELEVQNKISMPLASVATFEGLWVTLTARRWTLHNYGDVSISLFVRRLNSITQS